ncbi:MAG TPA: hypothetical protein VLE91_01465 [Candidatus Saccharimonadales bacterium]|nr:hypothetical protein [Candidatus Saccharimonadales bacterium]
MFVQSGLAKWMLQGLRNVGASNQTMWDFKVDDCNFGVYTHLSHDLKDSQSSMVIEYPNPDPSYRNALPRVETYFSSDPMFYASRGEKPPSAEQQKVVEDALKLQEADSQTTIA